MAGLKGMDILHGNQFSKKDLEAIMKVAAAFEKEVKGKGALNLLKGKGREKPWKASYIAQPRILNFSWGRFWQH